MCRNRWKSDHEHVVILPVAWICGSVRHSDARQVTEKYRMAENDSTGSHKSLLGDDACHGHSHGVPESDDQKKSLLYALVLTAVFVVAQIIVAVVANSLSLLADALHHLVDCVIVLTALLAIELSQRGACAPLAGGVSSLCGQCLPTACSTASM